MKKSFLLLLFFMGIIGVNAQDIELSTWISCGDTCGKYGGGEMVVPSGQIIEFSADYSSKSSDVAYLEVDIKYHSDLKFVEMVSENKNYSSTFLGNSVEGNMITTKYSYALKNNISDKNTKIIPKLKMPVVNVFSDWYQITLEIRAYDAQNKSLANAKETFNVIARGEGDGLSKNYDVDFKVSGGKAEHYLPPKEEYEFYEMQEWNWKENMYMITPMDGKINIAMTPKDKKAKIYYFLDGINISFGDNVSESNIKELNGSLDIPLDKKYEYEDEEYITSVMFLVESEYVYKLSQIPTSEKISGSTVVLGYGLKQVNTAQDLYVFGIKKPKNETNSGSNSESNSNSNSGTSSDSNSNKVELSSDNTLKSLVVNDKKVNLVSNQFNYNLTVENGISNAKITATPNNSKAKVTISNTNLNVGNNTINIVVTAENGSKKTYVLQITRKNLISNNSKLKSLVVENYKIDFDPDSTLYYLTLRGEKKLNITAIAENENAKVSINGNENLGKKSVIEIVVTAENGEATTYKITINDSYNMIFIYIVGGVFLLWLVLLLYQQYNNKKNHNKSSNTSQYKVLEDNKINLNNKNK